MIDPIILVALIAATATVVVAAMSILQVYVLHKLQSIEHNTNSMIAELRTVAEAAGWRRGVEETKEQAEKAAENVEIGRRQAKSEAAEDGEIDIEDVESIKVKEPKEKP